MKKIALSFYCIALVYTTAFAQQLVSATLLGTRTKAQLTTQFNLPLIQFGARFYRLTYTTPDVKGVTDTVSGLLVVPDDNQKVWPRVVYQHGTSSAKRDVPSFTAFNGEGVIGGLFAGLGYVAFAPDYLGLGVSEGIHPYVHAQTEAYAAIDMLRAAGPFLTQEKISVSKQLFITGYSQGGHAAMALHREIETNLTTEFQVTAAAHLSGPYSISGVMRDVMLSNDIYYYPAYLPNTMLSYQSAYGNIYQELTDVLKPVYATEVDKFIKGTINLSELNTNLITLLTTNEGASRPVAMFQPDVIAAVNNDPAHPVNVALKANDVYEWSPKAPTRIFYCTADDQVPYRNSVVAWQTMRNNGAADLQALDVNSTANHGQCVTPALTSTIIFFAGLQQIGTVPTLESVRWENLAVYPNPTEGPVRIPELPLHGQLTLSDLTGRVWFSEPAGPGAGEIDLSNLPAGIYQIRFETAEKVWRTSILRQ